MREHAREAVAASTAHRAAIEQAKGALMLSFGMDADAAFGLLRRYSNHRNVKLATLAEEMVSAFADPGFDRDKPVDGRFPAAGPAAHLVELPDATSMRITKPAEVDAYLTALQATRQRQLDATGTSVNDTVATAYRATLRRILEDIDSARQRLAAGVYGVCTRCHQGIPDERLQVSPAVATCVPCAAHENR